MYRSSWKLLILSTLLAGCTMPKPENRSTGDAATFYLDSSEIEINQTIRSEHISIPIGKTINFKACFKDNKLNKEVINHQFQIMRGNNEVKKVTSDKRGCVVWSENISYNYLGKASFVKIERSLKAEGIQKGQRTLGFAINPWEDKALSLQNTDVPNLLEGDDAVEALSLGSASKNLWLDDLRLTVDEKNVSKDGMLLNFEIRTQPSVVSVNSSGVRILDVISYGEFKIDFSLIHVVSENQKEVRRLLTAPVTLTKKMNSGFLFLEIPINLTRICTRGQIQLGIKMVALNAPENLKGFEGAFIVGDCDQIKGNAFSRLKTVAAENAGEFRLEEYINDDAPVGAVVPSNQAGTQTNTAQPDYYQTGQIEIRRLSFNNVGYKDQRTIIRDRVFNISACLTSGLDHKAMRAQAFQVKKVNGETTEVRTNNEGCLSWDDSYQFNYFAQECWKETSVTLSNSNLGVNQEIKLNINPWSSNESFLRDVRFIDKAGQQLVCAKGLSEIILTSYDFDKKLYSYGVDEFMNLKVKKQGLLKLTPRLKRPTLTEAAGFVEENLPVGKYLMKWAVADMTAQDLRKAGGKIFQTASKVINNNGSSTFVEDITFETKNIKSMGNTNQLIIEIYPLVQNPKVANAIEIDLDAEVALSVVRGAIVLANNNEGGTLEVFEKSGRSVIDAMEKQRKTDETNVKSLLSNMAKKEFFAHQSKMDLIDMSKPESSLNLRRSMKVPAWKTAPRFKDGKNVPEFKMADFKKWFDTGVMTKELGEGLCGYWVHDRLMTPMTKLNHTHHAISKYDEETYNFVDFCYMMADTKWAHKIFNVEYRYLVKNARLESNQPISTSAKEISINTSFGLQKSWGHSLNKSLSWDVGAGLKFLDIPFLSASTGVRYSVSKTESHSDGTSTNVTFQTGMSGVLEKLSFRLVTPEHEKCMIVRLNSDLFSTLKAPMIKIRDSRLPMDKYLEAVSSGIIFCEGVVKKNPISFEEDYYVINQRPLPLQTMDPSSEATRPFFVTVRGSSDFNTLMSFLQAQYKIPTSADGSVQNAEASSDVLKDAFKRNIPNYPGQYIRVK